MENGLDDQLLVDVLQHLYSLIMRTRALGNIPVQKYFPPLIRFAQKIQQVETYEEIREALFECFDNLQKNANGIFPNHQFIDLFSQNSRVKHPLAKEMLIDLELSDKKYHNSGDKDIEDSVLFTEAGTHHILPADFSKNNWPAFDPKPAEHIHINLIGNYCLLKGAIANDLSVDTFTSKLKAYATSGFTYTNQICQYVKWTPEILEERTKAIAKQLAIIWPLDCLETDNSNKGAEINN